MEEGGEGQAQAGPLGEEGFRIGDGGHRESAPGQRLPEELPAPRRFGADQDPLRGVLPGEEGFEAIEAGLRILAVAEVGKGADRKVEAVPGVGAEAELAKAPELLKKLISALEERVRGQDGSLGVVAEILEASLHLLSEGLRRRRRALEKGHQRALRKVAREAIEGVKKERQVVLNARGRAALSHILVDRAGPGVDIKSEMPAILKAL